MSLVVAVYVPTGIVVSADSRTVVTRTAEISSEGVKNREVTRVVLSDATEKVLVTHGRFVVATWGDAYVGNLPIAHHIRVFERSASPSSVDGCARGLLEHFGGLAPVPAVALLVAGFDGAEPHVFSVDVAKGEVGSPNRDQKGDVVYGILRGGDTDIVNRLLSNEKLLPPFHLMNMQDAVDYSRHLIRTTIDEMRFEPMVPTVGGPIDTLIVESGEAPRFLVAKSLRTE